jgi:hypothetical protein
MPEDWKKSYLPAGYLRNNHEDIVKVSNFIRELLKYEKSALAKMVSPGSPNQQGQLLTRYVKSDHDWSKTRPTNLPRSCANP